MPAGNDANDPMVPWSVESGLVRIEFAIRKSESANFAADVMRLLMEKYPESVEIGKGRDRVKRPSRVRNRPKGAPTQIREALLALKARSAIPDEIDARIPWEYAVDEEDQKHAVLPERGPQKKVTYRAYWDLVDLGLIITELPRPEEYATRYQDRSPSD